MAYSNWDFGFGEFPIGYGLVCGFCGLPSSGVSFHHAMWLDALMVGVGAHGGVKVKTPFKRPKTRVQGVVDLCSMWGCGSSSFFRFGSAGVVVCVE